MRAISKEGYVTCSLFTKTFTMNTNHFHRHLLLLQLHALFYSTNFHYLVSFATYQRLQRSKCNRALWDKRNDIRATEVSEKNQLYSFWNWVFENGIPSFSTFSKKEPLLFCFF